MVAVGAAQIPHTLVVIAIAALVIAGASALICVVDLLAGNRQHMWIMNVVWPIMMLWAGPIGLIAYYRVGRRSTHRAMQAKQHGESSDKNKPFWQVAAVADTHCGAGCTLGDLAAEWGIFLLAWSGVSLSLFGHSIFATWIVDYALAFAFGILFQYFTIKPMKDLSPRKGFIEAVKADTLSLTAWQIGMYGWMAIVVFVIFGRELSKTNPVFWFMMQIAMCAGFLTSYPVNVWLLRIGVKETM